MSKKIIEYESDSDDDEYSDDDEIVFVSGADETKNNDNDYEKEDYEEEDYEDSDDDEEDDEELQDKNIRKINPEMKTNIIDNYHPELKYHNYKEIDALSKVFRNQQGDIIDPFHKTIPILTKYEKARILGERAKQLEQGVKPLVEIEGCIDTYVLAEEELRQKKIPFIIQRPLPQIGGCEYWHLYDLEII